MDTHAFNRCPVGPAVLRQYCRFVLGDKRPLSPQLSTLIKQNLGQLPQMMGRKHPVHLGKALANPRFHLGLPRHAAAEKNFLIRMPPLGMAQGTQVAKYPLLGVFPNRAGVDDNQIRALRLRLRVVAHFNEHSQHPLAVRFILLAAVGVDQAVG